MKLKFLSVFLLSALLSHAEEKSVTASDFSEAYTAAADGDILIMQEGTYGGTLTFPSGKTITLKSAKDAAVVFGGTFSSADVSNANGGIIIDGINVVSQGNYFFDLKSGDIKTITLKNSSISGVGRCLLRTNIAGYAIEDITIDNTVIHDCGANGYSLIYPQHSVKKFTVTNSTLYNYKGGESLFSPKNTTTDVDINFSFTNNTVYTWSKGSSYALCCTTTKMGSGSVYTFENNIIYKPGVAGQAPAIISATGGTLSACNNLIVDYGTYKMINPTESTINDLTLDMLGLTELVFPDAEGGDFTIASTSPLSTAGKNGACLGAPVWIKNFTSAVNLTASASPIEGGTVTPAQAIYNSGDEITVTASNAYGYRFKEWQDGNGITLSTENPYKFIITTDCNLTAVFTTIDTYSLTINKTGEGALWGRVTLTPEPQNGIYETGTDVTISVIPNSVTSFLGWADGEASVQRAVTMDKNLQLAADFDVVPFIVAWDLYDPSIRNNREADYHYKTDNTGLLQLVNADGSTTSWGSGTVTFGGTARGAMRRYTDYNKMSAPRAFVVRFSATDYKNIKIHSLAGWNNSCVHQSQKMQYSTDGINYTDLTSLELGTSSSTEWTPFEATLPETLTDAEKASIYIRWIGDTTSPLIGTCKDTDTEGFYLADIVIFANSSAANDELPPVLVSSSPAAGSNTASATGRIILQFDEAVQPGSGNITFNGKTVTPVFGSKSVSISYSEIGYNTPCSLVIPADAITDLNGNAFAGTTITFSTMTRPQPVKRLFDAIVAQDGSGDYSSVQAAIDAAPSARITPYLIFIKKGTYDELVKIDKDKPFIYLIGQDKENTIIKHKINNGGSGDVGYEYSTNNPASANYGYQGVAQVYAADFYTENITYLNSWGVDMQSGPMDLAMKSNNDRQVFYNCKFRGFQDTWFTTTREASDRHYVRNCWIEGAVDYFYGAGDVFADSCTFYNVRSGSVITAPCHTSATKYGYVFNNCIVDGNSKSNDGKQALGRPWQNTPISIYLNTTFKIKVKSEGWNDMGECKKVLFAEYNSMDAEGNPVDLNNRKYQFYRNGTLQGTCDTPVLTAEQASRYTYENVMNGSDNWNPRKYMEAVAAPAALSYNKQSAQLSWSASDYAICYIVLDDNDNIVAFTTETSFDASALTSTSFTVKAVNEYGSLGLSSTVSTATGIAEVTFSQVISTRYYTLSGIEIKAPQQGVNIVREIKNDGSVNAYTIMR